MTKMLTRHGNSLALVIDKPILDLLNIDADTPLEITTDGSRLVVEPQSDPERKKKFRKSVDKMSKRYEKTLRRLAEWAMEPVFLTTDEIVELHELQLELHGGSAGIRDAGLLESALAQPRATFGGQ